MSYIPVSHEYSVPGYIATTENVVVYPPYHQQMAFQQMPAYHQTVPYPPQYVYYDPNQALNVVPPPMFQAAEPPPPYTLPSLERDDSFPPVEGEEGTTEGGEVDKFILFALGIYSICCFICLVLAMVGFFNWFPSNVMILAMLISGKGCVVAPIMGVWYNRHLKGSLPKSFWMMLGVFTFYSVVTFTLFLIAQGTTSWRGYHGGWVVSVIQMAFIGIICWRHWDVVTALYFEATHTTATIKVEETTVVDSHPQYQLSDSGL